jgi:hypothetical protein
LLERACKGTSAGNKSRYMHIESWQIADANVMFFVGLARRKFKGQ